MPFLSVDDAEEASFGGSAVSQAAVAAERDVATVEICPAADGCGHRRDDQDDYERHIAVDLLHGEEMVYEQIGIQQIDHQHYQCGPEEGSCGHEGEHIAVGGSGAVVAADEG